MIDSLSIIALVIAITIVVIKSVKFLYITINNTKNVSIALKNIRLNLEAIELILLKLRTKLKSEDSQVLLINNIKDAIENCNLVCSTFQKSLNY